MPLTVSSTVVPTVSTTWSTRSVTWPTASAAGPPPVTVVTVSSTVLVVCCVTLETVSVVWSTVLSTASVTGLTSAGGGVGTAPVAGMPPLGVLVGASPPPPLSPEDFACSEPAAEGDGYGDTEPPPADVAPPAAAGALDPSVACDVRRDFAWWRRAADVFVPAFEPAASPVWATGDLRAEAGV